MSRQLICDGCQQPIDSVGGYIHTEWNGDPVIRPEDDLSDRDFHDWECAYEFASTQPQSKPISRPGNNPPIDVHNVAHGHVRPRQDGNRTRCGGPRLCEDCAKEAATYLVQQR